MFHSCSLPTRGPRSTTATLQEQAHNTSHRFKLFNSISSEVIYPQRPKIRQMGINVPDHLIYITAPEPTQLQSACQEDPQCATAHDHIKAGRRLQRLFHLPHKGRRRSRHLCTHDSVVQVIPPCHHACLPGHRRCELLSAVVLD